jgi:hypothetical protein
LGGLVIGADIAHELAGKVLDGREDAARNDIAFDLGEPELYLIEPGGIGRREMQMKMT